MGGFGCGALLSGPVLIVDGGGGGYSSNLAVIHRYMADGRMYSLSCRIIEWTRTCETI